MNTIAVGRKGFYGLFIAMLSLAVLGLFAGYANAADPKAALTGFYEKVDTFSASFTQVSVDHVGSVVDESHGRLVLDRPDRFFWDYEAPFRQQIISDGAKVWLYDPDLAQVTVRKLGEAVSGTPAALLSGKDLELAFTISTEEVQGIEWTVLTPKNNDADFSRIRMRFENDLPKVMELRDQFEQTTSIEFKNVNVNPKVAKGTFEFAPPPNVEVVGDE